MRPVSILLLASLLSALLVGPAAARPQAADPPRPAPHRQPRTIVAIGGGLTVLGTLVALAASMPDGCDDCHLDRIPFVTGVGMIVLGPTLARLQIGEIGGTHLAVRIGGVGLFTLAALSARRSYPEPDQGAAILAAMGAGMVLVGALTDVGTAYGATRRWNQRHALTVVPATVSTRGALAPGLTLSARF